MDSSNAAARAASLVGRTLAGRYGLEAVLEAGVAWATFRAADARGGEVGVTVSYPEFFGADGGKRLLREAGTLFMLRHPHVVDTLGSGTDAALGVSFVAWTLSEARTVEAVLAELGALEPTVAVRIALQAARGLESAHQVGVLHRALSPASLRLESHPKGEIVVRVGGFGRRASDAAATPGAPGPEGPLDYLAPEELARSPSADERVDVWGLGAVLYEMLCGSPPFGHLAEDTDVALAIANDDVPHLQDRAPWVSPELSRAVHRALSRDPAHRFATLEEFASALRPASGGDELLSDATLAAAPSTLRSEIAARAELEPAPVTPADAFGGQGADELGLMGQVLGGRFRVERLLGRGGMGAVYEVVDEGGRHLAAKVIAQGLARENHPALLRFAREARAASEISSEHVVRTFDAGSDERLSLPYIVMELLSGTDLSSVMKKEGALEPEVAVRVVLQAARGIEAAHARDVVHRDIKPANLFLQIDPSTREVTVKVCDFGVAKRTRLDGQKSASLLSLTRTGGMLGSPMYMSPEQARNAKNVDGRADLWSLGVVLWEALAGRRLWGQRTSLGELIVSICTEPIPRVDEVAPWVPPDLGRALKKALERDLNRRTASIGAFIAEIEPFSAGSERVGEAELVGLSQERRQELMKKLALSLPPRKPASAPARPVEPANVPKATPLAATAKVGPPPAAPLAVTPEPRASSATPRATSNPGGAAEPATSGWLFALIVAVLAAVTVAVVLLR